MKIPIRRFQKRYQLALLFSLLTLFGVSISAQRIWETLPAGFKEKVQSTRRATAPAASPGKREIKTSTEAALDPAQGSLAIPQNVLPGGGGRSSGGALALDATIGQGLAGGALSGGTLSVSGGFWGGGAANQCPTITVNNPQDPSGVIGTPLSRTFTQSGISGTATFSLNSGTLPTGVTLATNGTLSGTPMQFGNFPITVRATDSNNCTGTGATYTLVISCQSLSVINPVLNTATVGQTFNANFTHIGGIGTVTFAVNSGALPTGLTLMPNGTLTGQPSQAGSFTFSARIVDSNGCGVVGLPYTLVVTGGQGCPTINITPTSLPPATQNAAYSQQLTASGGATPYSFVVNAGALPTGLSLNSSGLLAGAATAAGAFNFGVSATDANGCAATRSYSLQVNPPVTTARIVRAVDASGAPGSPVVVPIELVSQGDENAVSFSLNFDPAILSNPQAALGSDAAGASLNVNTGQMAAGRLGLVLALPAGQAFSAGTRRIFAVTFTIVANTSADAASITFGNQPVQQEIAGTTADILPASYVAGTVTVSRGTEADVNPRPNGNGSVTVSDYVLVGRFAAGLDTAANGSEFQRADCAPRGSLGNGAITVSDFVQAGRYAAGLDPTVPAGGPTAPINLLPESEKNREAIADAAAQARVLRVVNATAAPGGMAAVAIELAAQGNENALGFSLTFNSAVLGNPVTTLGSGAAGASLNANVSQTAQGRLGIVLALPAGQSLPAGTRQLVVVTFTVAAGAPAGAVAVDFGNQPVARETVDANANDLATTYTGGTVTVQATCPTISIAPTTLAAGQIGQAYSRQLTQTGGAGAIAWTISTGALPNGITLNASTGLLSGTPVASGTFTFTVRATDAGGCAGTQSYTLTIAACPAITIAPGSLSNGTVGVAYSRTLTAGGGTPPYSFSVNTGSTLPAGLTLSAAGVLSGTPTAASAPSGFSFTVKVTDAGNCSGTQNYSLTVNAGSYAVSGRVTDRTGNGIAGVTMTFSNTLGGAGSVQTDAGGNWTQSGFIPPSTPSSCTANPYTARPSKAGFVFTPETQTFCAATTLNFTGTAVVTTVSAASFLGQELAQESIVAAFGQDLATRVEIANTTPLPTTLAGTTVKIRDSAGTERNAPLFFVAPSQINYQIPPGTAVGAAAVTVTSGDNKTSVGTINVSRVAPALFTANASGQGVPAALVLRVRNGVQSFEPVSRQDFSAIPIDLGPETDVVYLLLFGGGARNRTSTQNISIDLGGTVKTLNPAIFEDAFAVPGFVGLDQISVLLPRSLAGKGNVNVTVTVDGKPSNTVQLNFK